MARLNRLRYDGVTDQPWRAPSLALLTRAHDRTPETDEWGALDCPQKRHLRHHFLATVGETDAEGLPDSFDQLALPVVTPTHKLSTEAVDEAEARLGTVEALRDVEDELRARIGELRETL